MAKIKKKVPEVRFPITSDLDKILNRIATDYGITKASYVKSLIINDLRSKEQKR